MAAMEPAQRQKTMTRVDVLMDAFEDFAIGITLRSHAQLLKRPESKAVTAHVEKSRVALRAALTDFTRPMLRVVDNEPNGKAPD